MANDIVNIYSDALFNSYSRLSDPSLKGSQNGWPYFQTETPLRIFQEAAEPHIRGNTHSATSSSSPSPPPRLQSRPIWLQSVWPVCVGAVVVICCVLALAWQAHRQALANARLQHQDTEIARTWRDAAQQLLQSHLEEARVLNSNQAAFATSQAQIGAGLAKLSDIDTQLAASASTQASAIQGLAAAHTALAQETTNLVVSLHRTIERGLAEAASRSSADRVKVQAQMAEETTNLVASFRRTFQQGLAEAGRQSRADTVKLQTQIAEETTNVVASLRRTFQQALAEAGSQSRADTVKLQTQIAEMAASYKALLDRLSGSTNVPNLALALPGVTGCAASEQAPQKYRMTTPIPPGIASPERVETRLGTLKFSDGSLGKNTSEKLFRNLDFERAVQAYLLALPPVSMVAIREVLTQWGPANSTIPIFETLMDSRSLFLTANYNAPYTWMWIDLHHGPLVAEIPPKVLGMIKDFWFHTVTDMGFVGPDKGAGGKYLILPPGYKGEVPEGYLVVKASTFEGFLGWRNFLVNGDPKPGIDDFKKLGRVYPLSQAANPPANKFVHVSGQAFNAVDPADYKFWEYLNQVVQGEPSGSLDPMALEFYASVGLQKGKPFTPDARMKKILAEAAAVGDATARAIASHSRQNDAYYFPSSFTTAWPPASLPPWR